MVKFLRRKQRLYMTILLLTYSCIMEVEPEEHRRITMENPGNHNQLIISNTSNKLSRFSLNINNQGLNNFEDIKSTILDMSNDFPNEPPERKAWRFVMERFEYSMPLCFEQWAQHPLVALNSIGSGYSGDHALLLYHIWRQLGFESRIWKLNGHDVAEVRVNGKWQMYDSTYEIFYLNEDKEVAGVQELILNPKLITDPLLGDLPVLPHDLRAIYNFAYRHSAAMVEIYTSEKDNVKSTWIRSNEDIKQIFIELPPKSYLTLPVFNEEPIVVRNEYEIEKKFDHCFKISLSRPYEGEIAMPYYLSSLNGAGTVYVDQKPLQFTEGRIELLPKNNMDFPQKISVTDVQNEMDLYYLYGPREKWTDSDNVIALNGFNLDSLVVASTFTKGEKREAQGMELMYEPITMKTNWLAVYEQNSTIFEQEMFNRDRPIASVDDMGQNLTLFFSTAQSLESEIITADSVKINLLEKIKEVSAELNENKKEQLFQILSESRFVVAMIQMSEIKSPDFMGEFLKGILKYSESS